jgi:uncharacterized protein (DUF2141 family)
MSTPRLPILSSLLAAAGVLPAALLAVMLVYPQAAAAEPAKAQLTVTITNIKEYKGALSLGIYDAAGYETDKAVNGGSIPVTGGTATATFDLPPGQYGIKIFHDVNGDGKMSTNPFGMPTEPFAFSNNAPAQFGPARWDAARFDVTAPVTTHAIRLN